MARMMKSTLEIKLKEARATYDTIKADYDEKKAKIDELEALKADFKKVEKEYKKADAAVKKLEGQLNEILRSELVESILKSNKSVEEIKAFLQATEVQA